MRKLEENEKNYDRQLLGDWVLKTIAYCQNQCVKTDRIMDAKNLTEVEKQCGKNCLRKHDKSYKLYESVESRLGSVLLKDLNIDEEELSREMIREEKRKL